MASINDVIVTSCVPDFAKSMGGTPAQLRVDAQAIIAGINNRSWRVKLVSRA